MARPYFLFPEDLDNSKYRYNSMIKFDQFLYEEKIKVDGVYYTFADEMTERVVEISQREYYGYDYVIEKEAIEILIDDTEWVTEELFDLEEMTRMIDELELEDEDLDGELEEDEDYPFNYSDDIPGFPDDIDIRRIDESLFLDPIKLLKYLDSIDKRQQNTEEIY